MSDDQRLLLITPVHNEAPHLRQVVESVARQTRPPDQWVVVDDNSSDGSGELLRELLAPLPFATLIETTPAYTVTADGDRNAAGGPDRAWNYGLRHTELETFTHVGKLDGDIVLPPDYLAGLLARFRTCPRLGMAAGTVTERRDDQIWVMPTPPDQVTAPARLYSVDCFTAIGGMPPYMGADVVTTGYAKMRGFETVTVAEYPVLHLRPMATADGLRRGRERQGAYQYVTHYSFLWVFLRSFVVGARFRPRGLSGAWFLWGYVKAALRGQPRVEDPEWQAFARAERRSRVAAAVRRRLPGGGHTQRAGATTAGPIAYVVGRYPAVSHTFILREVIALRERGVEVIPISIHRARPGDLLSEADRREAAKTLAVLPPDPRQFAAAHLRALVRRPGGYLRALRKAWQLARPGARGHIWAMLYFIEAGVVWAQCRGHDVRHLHAHHLNQASDAALLAVEIEGHDERGRPRWTWSFTMHGPTELVDVAAFRVPEKTRSAAAVACISDFARAQLIPFLAPTDWPKLHVVRCGLLVNEWPHPERSTDAEVDDRLRILCIGRLVPEKAHSLLLEATRTLIDRGIAAHTTLIGDGPQRRELEATIRRLGLNGAVDLLGAVSQDDLRRHFLAADAFALSSTAEGLPVVLMEAMAMCLPVVATNVAGTTELVQDRVNGLVVPPGRSDLLADALERLAHSPELRRTLGSQGRETVVRGFDVRDSAAELEKMFAEVAAR